MKIDKIEFIDHGIEHASYFQGCGVAYTDFDTCFTGIGVNAITAISDCVEQATCLGYKLDPKLQQDALNQVTFDDVVVPEDADDVYYHVSMRIKAKGEV